MHRFRSFLIDLRGLYAALACALCVLVAGVIVLLLPGLSRRRWVARWGLRVALFCAAIPFRVRDLDRLPDGPCVVIANHRSYLDGLVLIAALPAHFTPVIKVEVQSVPLIGLILQRVGARYVQREPAMQAGRDTKHLLDALRAGESLAVFPEGTFSVDDGLLPFREGAFFLAAKAGVPVVPVAIQGTRDVLPLERILPCPASIRVCVLELLRSRASDREAAETLRDQTEAALWHGLKPDAPERPGRGPDYDYYLRVFHGRSLPLAYLDVDLLEHNIRSVLARSGGKRLRVDARALRCPAVIDRVLRSNIRFHGVECATIHEAIYLATEWELEDLLVAYPTLQREAIAQACQAVGRGCDITLVADSVAHLERLSEEATRAGVRLPVCVDVDLSARRISRHAPLRITKALQVLVGAIEARESLCLRGLLAPEPQRSGGSAWVTSLRGQGDPDQDARASTHGRLQRRRGDAVEWLQAKDYNSCLIKSGAASSIEHNAADPNITEMSIGSALVAPEAGDNDDVLAVGLAAEVIRRTDYDRYVYNSGGRAAGDRAPPWHRAQPYLPAEAVPDACSNTGGALVPIRYAGPLRLGDPVFLHPYSASALCERFNQLLLVQDGVIIDAAPTYRALGDRLQ